MSNKEGSLLSCSRHHIYTGAPSERCRTSHFAASIKVLRLCSVWVTRFRLFDAGCINQCIDMPLVTYLNGRLGWTSSESLHNSITVYQHTYIYITCRYVVQIYEATGGCDGAWLSYSTCNHVHQYIKISGCYTPHDEPTAPIGRPVRMFSHTTYLARLSVADMHPLPVLATITGSITLDF